MNLSVFNRWHTVHIILIHTKLPLKKFPSNDACKMFIECDGIYWECVYKTVITFVRLKMARFVCQQNKQERHLCEIFILSFYCSIQIYPEKSTLFAVSKPKA